MRAAAARLGDMQAALLVCGFSLLCAGVVAAAEKGVPAEARAWLEKMSRAAHSYSYDGIFIYLQGNELQSVRVIHSAGSGGERERMVLLNGVQREVVRTAERITYLVPESRTLALERHRGHPQGSFPPLTPQRIDKLVASYDVSLAGRDRVAGRETQRIAIQPKDELRYGYQLWLDTETGLLLRSSSSARGGRISEQFMFVDVQFLEQVPPALLESEISGGEVVYFRNDTPDGKQEPEPDGHWHAAELPYGFELSMHRHYSAGRGRGIMEQLVYSDGLTSVSVFIERLGSRGEPLRGGSSLGAVNAFGTTRDDYQVIALGEVPAETVRRIASSMQRRADHD